MTHTARTTCFHCGQDAAETARINRLPDGRPCPSCADRLLDLLPPLIPGYDPQTEPANENELAGEFEDDYDRPA